MTKITFQALIGNKESNQMIGLLKIH